MKELRNKVIYQVFPRQYSSTHDFKGVYSDLDRLEKLKVDYIYLLPIHPIGKLARKGSVGSPYSISDYRSINKDYGGASEFLKLISECHKRNIKLIIDLVLNHSGKANPYFSKACNAYNKYLKGLTLTSEEEAYKDFYVFYPTAKDIPSNVTAYKAGPSYDFYYEGNFSDNMPEFNCDSPAVKEEFKNIMKFYLDMGIDGFSIIIKVEIFYCIKSKSINT